MLHFSYSPQAPHDLPSELKYDINVGTLKWPAVHAHRRTLKTYLLRPAALCDGGSGPMVLISKH
jgi:hypothetical protein